MDRFSKDFGGYLRKTDLMDYKPEWVDPISVNYRGYDVWEIPPNAGMAEEAIMSAYSRISANSGEARSYGEQTKAVYAGAQSPVRTEQSLPGNL